MREAPKGSGNGIAEFETHMASPTSDAARFFSHDTFPVITTI